MYCSAHIYRIFRQLFKRGGMNKTLDLCVRALTFSHMDKRNKLTLTLECKVARLAYRSSFFIKSLSSTQNLRCFLPRMQHCKGYKSVMSDMEFFVSKASQSRISRGWHSWFIMSSSAFIQSLNWPLPCIVFAPKLLPVERSTAWYVTPCVPLQVKGNNNSSDASSAVHWQKAA